MAQPVEPATGGRNSFNEYYKGQYPDRTHANDDEMFSAIQKDYEDNAAYRKQHDEVDEKFNGLMNSDPRTATFFKGWMSGQSPAVMMLRQWGPDIKAALDDPEKQDEIAEAEQQYLEEAAQAAKDSETYDANLQKTADNLTKFQEETGISDEETDEVWKTLKDIASNACQGLYIIEHMKAVLNSIRHDSDVKNAGDEGEIRGKNARIEKNLKSRKAGDGVADLQTSGSRPGAQVKDTAPAVLRKFDGNDIFARGGERRMRRN